MKTLTAARFTVLMLVLALLGAAPPLPNLRGIDRLSVRADKELHEVFAPVVEKAAKSTVRVLCDRTDAALGTIVDADGYILTKLSELSGRVSVRFPDGKIVDAKLVGASEDNDLAMLKADAKGLTPVAWADATKIRVGQWVATPDAGGNALAVGVLSVERRKIPPQSGRLGIGLGDASGGVRITQVVPDSGAAKAGLQVDDVIAAVNEKATPSREALVEQIGNFKPGDQVSLAVSRGEKKLTVTVTLSTVAVLGATPSRTDMMNNMSGKMSRRATGFPAVLQHDTVLEPDQCGGPIVELDGKVLGINIARAGRIETYAIPADVLQKLIPDLKSGKLAPIALPASASTTQPSNQ